MRAQASDPFAGMPPIPVQPAGDVVITTGWATNRVTAIDLATISQGYPLLWLSRHCGVAYAEMLAAHARWVEWGSDWTSHVASQSAWVKRWQIVLTEAFTVLTREGVLLHPSIEPLRRPALS